MNIRTSLFRNAAVALAAAVLVLPAQAQERRPDHGGAHAAHEHPSTDTSARPMLLAGLGSWRHPVTTSVPAAREFFDQGLRLAYGFNHDESARSFREAARLDPSCALCWWGVAYALSPNINLPMTADAEQRALDAIRSAQRLASGASRRERMYIEAMARRLDEPAGADRARRDSAYAAAMESVAARWPGDADAQVLYADALLNLRPWNQWTPDGQPQPGTLRVIEILERVIAATPSHAGACHFYVHTVEASPDPARALPCAERLPTLMPGAGHIVHMPAHVYLRVGRYADAARANIAAVAADRAYLATGPKTGDFYASFYPAHNEHFLWMTYLLSGQRAKARDAAAALTRSVPVSDARANASLEAFLATAVLTHARFGDWDAVLAEAAPPVELRYWRGMWHYARGLARANRGELAKARLELDSLRAMAAAIPASTIIILNPAPAVLELAASVLAGEMALREGRFGVALEHLRDAVKRETGLTYDEPPAWYHSTRHQLGLALLAAGDGAEAEAAFRDDLRVFPETGWSLAGLERALRVQQRYADARQVAERLARAWRDADVPAITPR